VGLLNDLQEVDETYIISPILWEENNVILVGLLNDLQEVDETYIISPSLWEESNANGICSSQPLHVVLASNMTDEHAFKKWLNELMELEEHQFMIGFNKKFEKCRKKAWHDKNIITKTWEPRSLIFLYDTIY
jgi:hypothetical protein